MDPKDMAAHPGHQGPVLGSGPLGLQQHQPAGGQQWPQGLNLRLPLSPREAPQLALVMAWLRSPGGRWGPGARGAHWPPRSLRHPSVPRPPSRPKCTLVPSGLGSSQALHYSQPSREPPLGPGFGRKEPRPPLPMGTEQYHSAASASRGATGIWPPSFSRMQRGWAGRRLGRQSPSWGKQAGGPVHLRGLCTAPAWPTEGAPAQHHLRGPLPGPPWAGAAAVNSAKWPEPEECP